MNPPNRRILTSLVVLQLLVLAVADAQDIRFGTLPAADADLDLSIPETPAF